LALGLVNATDLKDKGKYVNVGAGPAAISWGAFDPNSKDRLPVANGTYRPQFIVDRSLAWPESLRANVEADMVASKPLHERDYTLDVVLRARGYELSLDGIPLTNVDSTESDPRGFARLTLTPNVELASITQDKSPS